MMKKTYFFMAAAVVIAMAAASCRNANTASAAGEDTAYLETEEFVTEDSVKTSGEIDLADFVTTESGLRYKVITQGKGAHPTATDNVTVHYTGRHLDGSVFDSSVERGEPATFPLNQVIKGWTEGVQLMQEGAKYEFYIPSNLAYGEHGTPGGPIAPNEDLIFEVELIKIN